MLLLGLKCGAAKRRGKVHARASPLNGAWRDLRLLKAGLRVKATGVQRFRELKFLMGQVRKRTLRSDERERD